MNFLSEALGMWANITVCLPGFTFADLMEKEKTARETYVPGMKFQMLYLLHGGGEDDSDFIHSQTSSVMPTSTSWQW